MLIYMLEGRFALSRLGASVSYLLFMIGEGKMFMFMMFVVLESNKNNAEIVEGLIEFAQKQWQKILFNNPWGSSFV